MALVVIKRLVLISSLVCLPLLAHGRTLEGVDFPEQQDLGGQKLLLNGVGLRVVRKLGMNFRVYVAGLYVMSKGTDAKTFIESIRPTAVNLVFLRSVEAASLRKGWTEGYEKVCKDKCESTKANLKMFNDFMVDVKEHDTLQLLFTEDAVTVNVTGKGREPHSGHITNPEFRRNMLAVFIGDDPPTQDLKKGLLEGK